MASTKVLDLRFQLGEFAMTSAVLDETESVSSDPCYVLQIKR